jgi:sugar O-acyltransferase (sialic acid O-acetyltransferase NeuD family)
MPSMNSFIFGAGGHARTIASLLDVDVTFVVLDELAAAAHRDISHYVTEDWFFENIETVRSQSIYIGIGANKVRAAIYDNLKLHGIAPSTCIAKYAFVARDAEIAEGAVICAGAVIGAGATVGRNTIVNTHSSIDHDCVLGDHSQVTVGVTFGGGVITGTQCFFGLKSGVLPNVTIGNNVSVMAGSLVTKPLPDGVSAGGYPARITVSVDGRRNTG